MRCPKCEVIELVMTDRAGVEIDYCTACRGVWLDRGELDKIIDRAALPTGSPGHQGLSPESGREREYYDEDDDDDDDRHGRRNRRKRRGGFLGELFDF